jgi:molecular chaperone HtpG
MAKDCPDDYQIFWQAFGQLLKEGVVEDTVNKAQIICLIRFYSTYEASDTANTSLSDYVLRMKKGQEKIYFITSNSLNAAKNSPHLEVLCQKNIEVLLLVDRIDEWLMASLTDFEGKVFQSVAKGQLDLSQIKGDDDKMGDQPFELALQGVIDKLKQVLGDKVAEVRITNRLVDSPSCLVVDEKAISQHFEQLLREAGQSPPKSAKPILEINPYHVLIQRLSEETDAKYISDLSLILYDQARLMDGAKLDDPATFVASLNRLMSLSVVKKQVDRRSKSMKMNNS